MPLTVTVQKGHDFSSGNVTRAALNAGAVPSVAITGAVGTTELSDSAVTSAKLATDAVESDKIKALAVVEAKLGADAVTREKLANASVTSDNLLVNKNASSSIKNIIDGLNPLTGDVAVDDYLIVHDTSATGTDDEQLFKAKVSKVQKVGTTEYALSSEGDANGPTITNPDSSTPSVQVDLDGSPFQTIELIGGKTYTFSSLSNPSASAVKTVTLRVVGTDTGTATLSLPPWVWPERSAGAAPTGIATGKTALLSLTAFGTGDSNVIAAFAVTV
tara:strand:+ start:104 stop:925 length:822 start_codon:yes stop_codon:yes gene_type:complete